ncbi:hypothetical protein J6590_084027 [Homalodisca vitripennis]|nr:hypothetical protein J6590_084027 [Homalodisca vitripennis]
MVMPEKWFYYVHNNLFPNTTTKDGIKCSDCTTVCHLKCVGVVTRNKKWKCESCAVECASNSSKTSQSRTASSTILDAIAAFRKENNNRWDSNNIKLDKVQAEVKSVKSDLKKVKAQCREAGENVGTQRRENKKLTEELATVKQQVLDYTRKNNLLISGVPVTPRESVYDILGSITQVLYVSCRGVDILLHIDSRAGKWTEDQLHKQYA